MSPIVLTWRNSICCPRVEAAACRSAMVESGVFDSTSTAKRAPGMSSRNSPSSFGPRSEFNAVRPVTLPPAWLRLLTEPVCPGSWAVVKTIGIVVVAALAAARCRGAEGRDDDGHTTVNQIGHQCRHSVEMPLRPTVFDRHVAALDMAGFAQA